LCICLHRGNTVCLSPHDIRSAQVRRDKPGGPRLITFSPQRAAETIESTVTLAIGAFDGHQRNDAHNAEDRRERPERVATGRVERQLADFEQPHAPSCCGLALDRPLTKR
jgi:hypothetical protein